MANSQQRHGSLLTFWHFTNRITIIINKHTPDHLQNRLKTFMFDSDM